jgi:predicted ATPase/DNA-binding XRE family transcriptional regulator
MSVLGNLLRRDREQLGLSQEELAALVEPVLSPDTISNLERGRTRPHRHTLEALCRALNLNEAARQTVWAAWRAAGSGPSPISDRETSVRRSVGPTQPTPLIGRDSELLALEQRLLQPQVRLLTLVGPGGVGKTRLALKLLERVEEQFRDRATFIDLSSLRDTGLVVVTVTHALGIHEVGGQPVLQRLVEALVDRNLLVVLDNFEHVLDAAGSLGQVLGACPGVKLLVTSREPLRLRWEHLHVVPPLGVPDANEAASLASVEVAPAVELFMDRARAVAPAFALTEANATTIADLCRRLDGLPLALELSAAAIRAVSPTMLLEHLDQRLDLLKGARDAPARQQSLRATLDWSYDLLSEVERHLFEHLSVFAGGWDLKAAEAVAAVTALKASAVLDVLARLVDRSMVVADGPIGSCAARYRLLDTLRQYARERLELRGDEEATRARHAAFFSTVAEQAEQELHGPNQRHWLQRLDADQANLREALAWVAARDEVVPGMRLVNALWRFWSIRGHLAEGRVWLEQMLLLSERGRAAGALRIRALRGSGHLAFAEGDIEVAETRFNLSHALACESEDHLGVAASLRDLGSLAQAQGDYARATMLFQQSLDLYRELADRAGIATCLVDLGEVARHRGEYEQAQALDEEALALQRDLADGAGMAFSLNELANVARHQGDYVRGRRFATEALVLQRALGDLRGAATSLNNLGIMAQASGEPDEAARAYQEAFDLFRRTGDKHGISIVLPGLADLALRRGDMAEAKRLTQDALRLHTELREDRAIAQRLDALGRLARLTEDFQQACHLHRESLLLFARIGDRRGVGMALDGFATLWAAQGDAIRATQLFAVAGATRADLRVAPDFGAYVDPALRDTAIADLRTRLGEDEFIRAWEHGRMQSLESAVASVLSETE